MVLSFLVLFFGWLSSGSPLSVEMLRPRFDLAHWVLVDFFF